MKYVVITTKHHEGFSLFDSKETDYKVTNTPYGKDLIRPLLDALREEGLRVGFYYSVIDWYHPEFTIDLFHPMREDKQALANNDKRDMEKYRKFLHAQVRELLTNYGRIDYLFYDFSYSAKGHKDWQSEKLIKMTRELQPRIVVNDRLDLDREKVPGAWDFKTPEQTVAREWVKYKGKPVAWETCQTFSGAWGYNRDEATWKSVEQLLFILISSVGKGGNLLLNVGPTARGTFDDRAMARLTGMGEWMKVNSRSIYGCTQAPAQFPTPENCLLTYNKERKCIYVHLLFWPVGEIHLDGFAGKVKYAQLLHDASELKMREQTPEEIANIGGVNRKTLTVTLPIQKPNVAIPVIELFLR